MLWRARQFSNSQLSKRFTTGALYIVADLLAAGFDLSETASFSSFLSLPRLLIYTMAPLILHNVPEDERYIGEDGVRRPYAVLFPVYAMQKHPNSARAQTDDYSPEGHASTSRVRKSAPETGSFGKPTRRGSQRSSKTATPAKREDPTILASDALFNGFFASQPLQGAESQARKPGMGASLSQTNLSATNVPADLAGSQLNRFKEPTEVILRGFLPSHQYAAIDSYERIAGRICEDYPRDPPHEQRRYQFDLRDRPSMQKPLTSEERAKALRFAGGEHWIKITFESAQAAEAATTNSPQKILGHMVYAELYRGVPPVEDVAVPAISSSSLNGGTKNQRHNSQPGSFLNGARRPSSTLPRSFITPEMSQVGPENPAMSPGGSNDSSHTLDSATLSTATMSSATASSTTIVGQPSEAMQVENSVFCRKIPAARRAQLMPAEQALLPQQSYSQRFLSNFGLAGWFKIELIGSQTPRLDNGEFDWATASLYWRLMWWLDSVFNLMGGEIAGSLDKED